MVAPRLGSADGVERALASVEPPWLEILHVLAMRDPMPFDALFWRCRSFGFDEERTFYRELGEGLLNRGLVLTTARAKTSPQYQALVFHVPAYVVERLPPYPIEVAPIGPPLAPYPRCGDVRATLRAELKNAGPRRFFSLQDGVLQPPGDGTFAGAVAALRHRWAAELSPYMMNTHDGAAFAWILAHLPEGQCCPITQLQTRYHHRLPDEKSALSTWIAQGVAMGLLTEHAAGLVATPLPPDPPLAWINRLDGIAIDIDRSGIGPILSLAPLCRARIEKSQLLLSPDVARMGRAITVLPALLEQLGLRGRVPAFDQAMARLTAQHGQVRVHEGLAVLQVRDEGLLTVLSRDRDVRVLGGGFLAVPEANVDAVLAQARKLGYAARRAT